MDKYSAFLDFTKENQHNPPKKIIVPEISAKDMIEIFEIAWESGQFNEEPKGECCSCV